MTEIDHMICPGLNVSRETLSQLEAYSDLIRKWTLKINLIAPNSVKDIWQRHIIDSAQLVPMAPEITDHWVDLGSGAGLPGVVVSIIMPRTRVTMIESDKRKATFLRTCVRELNLNATILTDRAEAAEPQQATVVSARALSPLATLMPLVIRHLQSDGIALLPKGKNAQDELNSAQKNWAFDVQRYPSHTSSDATILSLKRITRA